MKLYNLYFFVITFVLAFINAKVTVLDKKNFYKVCLVYYYYYYYYYYFILFYFFFYFFFFFF